MSGKRLYLAKRKELWKYTRKASGMHMLFHFIHLYIGGSYLGGCSICNSYLYLYKLCSIIYVFYTSTKVSKIYFKKTDLFQLYFMSIFVIFSEIYSGLCAWRYFQHWKSEGETCRRDPDTSRLCVLVRGEEKRNEETSK